MELTETIRSRRSIRGYLPKPVPREVLADILDLARLSPSGINCQPWEFVVLTGESLQKAKDINARQVALGGQPQPDVAGYKLSGVYQERQRALGKQMYQLMDIARDDAAQRQQWVVRGMRFYDAPAAILICADDAILNSQSQMALLDLGIITQTIVLLAAERGLGTCIEGAAVVFPDALRKALQIHSSKRLVLAVAIGYPDDDFPANSLRTERESLEALTSWKD